MMQTHPNLNFMTKFLSVLAKFFKQLFCSHYWAAKSRPMDPAAEFGMHEFTCVKCECKKVRMWNWSIRQNSRKQIS